MSTRWTSSFYRKPSILQLILLALWRIYYLGGNSLDYMPMVDLGVWPCDITPDLSSFSIFGEGMVILGQIPI